MTNCNIKSNIGARFLAGLIDYTIIFAIIFLIIMNFGEETETGYELNGLSGLLSWFIPWVVFTIGFEKLFGATLGNGIVGLKPIQENFYEKISLSQSVKRHLADPVDMFFFGLVAILTIRNTDKKQRVGDIWAKTIVVKHVSKKSAE